MILFGILVKIRSSIQVNTMVVFVKISKTGALVRIKEVPDTYRGRPYRWDEDE
jgi:hypothetical protein